MKKISLLIGLSALCIMLSACGNKNLSFQEAKEIAMKNSNQISDLLFGKEGASQQTLSLTTSFSDGSTALDVALTSQSQQDKASNKSKADITFNAGVASEQMKFTASGALTLLLTADNLFLNLEKF